MKQFLRIDALLSNMQNHHCKLDFHLLQRWSWLQPEALKKGEIDGGFVYGIPEEMITSLLDGIMETWEVKQ
ncbi:MAG: hypothetical protein EHJ94_03730 [Deltaproteobacteria bacterium]|jgi:hypothetical protein|nr:MAG: hypothetical protein EHJ94_03730 [Deltaproteobacteria bacterium]